MDLPREESPVGHIEVLSIQLFMTAIVCVVISPGVVLTKLLGRPGARCIKEKVEEAAIIFAACFSVALSVLMIIVSQPGLGSGEEEMWFLRKIYPNYIGSQSCYRAASSLAKLAIIFQCMESYQHFWEFVVSGAVLTLMAAESTICIAITLFGGQSSFTEYGHPVSNRGTIIESFLVYDGGFTIGYNLALLLLIIPAALRIRLGDSPKFALCINTTLVILMEVVSVQRMLTFRALEPMDPPAILGVLSAALWGLLEVNFTIMCACMPGLWTKMPRRPASRGTRPRGPNAAQAADIELTTIFTRTTRARTA